MKGHNLELQRKIQEQKQLEENKEESLFSRAFKQEEQQQESALQGEKTENLIARGFKEATMKDDIDELGGPAPGEPAYIGLEKKFTRKQEGDSGKMEAVRLALDAYHNHEQMNISREKAMDDLIAACDKYCSGRFRLFKWGRGKQRLEEVMALREKVMQERDAYRSGLEQEDGSVATELIYNNAEDAHLSSEMEKLKKAGVGKLLVAGLATIVGLTVGNVIKLATFQPLWRKKVGWKPKDYFRGTLGFLDRTFGRVTYVDRLDEKGNVVGLQKKRIYDTDTSQKEKDKSATFAAENAMMKADREMLEEDGFDGFDEEAYIDEGYDNDLALINVKRDLAVAYGEDDPDTGEVERLEKELEERSRKSAQFTEYMKENKADSGFVPNISPELDQEVTKARNVYKNTQAVKALKEQDKQTRERVEKEGKTEEFRQMLKEQAMDNVMDENGSADKVLTERDKAYDEEELKAKIEQFEEFDLRTISFENNVDMLRDYKKNKESFEYVRSVHYELFKGIASGYKLDDERLIRLRAKFKCAFEMEDYMIHMNRMILRGESEGLDLVKDQDKIDEYIKQKRAGAAKKEYFYRQLPKPGDTGAFLAECEEKVRSEYKNREKSIKALYRILEKGGEKGSIPGAELKKKADAYETNAVVYDYIQYAASRYAAFSAPDIINSYNQKNEKTEDNKLSTYAERWEYTWMYGKSMEDRIRLTELRNGPNAEKKKEMLQERIAKKESKIEKDKLTEEKKAEIEQEAKTETENEANLIKAKNTLAYYKEMIVDMKSFDLKEFDTRDIGKFYENFERKRRILWIYTNARYMISTIRDQLKLIRASEIEEAKKKDPDYKVNPKERLKLPEDYKELGYADYDELVKDLAIAQDVGNVIQGKMDSLAQISEKEYLPYYSLEEIFGLDAEKSRKITENHDKYWEQQMEDKPDFLEKDPVAQWVEEMNSFKDLINIPIRTREVSKEESKEGKLTQNMTGDVDIMEIYREEQEYYDKMKILEGRSALSKKDRVAESKKAKAYKERIDSIYTGRNAQVTSLVTNDRRRFIGGYVGPMAYFYQDSKEKTAERVRALETDPKNATTEQKQKMAKELENAFSLIVNFDLQEMNFDKVQDVCEEAYEKVAVMARFCFEFNVLFNDYQKLQNDPDVETLLTKEEFEEVKAKKDFIQMANTLYNTVPEAMSQPQHEEMDAVRLLTWTDDQFSEEIEKQKKNPSNQVYLANASMTAAAFRQLGIIPGIDMESAYRKQRVAALGAPKEDPTESIKKKLQKQ